MFCNKIFLKYDIILHIIVRSVCMKDPERYTSSSIATGSVFLADRSKGGP